METPEITSSAELAVGADDKQASKKSRKRQARFLGLGMEVTRNFRVRIAVCKQRLCPDRNGFGGRKLKRG